MSTDPRTEFFTSNGETELTESTGDPDMDIVLAEAIRRERAEKARCASSEIAPALPTDVWSHLDNPSIPAAAPTGDEAIDAAFFGNTNASSPAPADNPFDPDEYLNRTLLEGTPQTSDPFWDAVMHDALQTVAANVVLPINDKTALSDDDALATLGPVAYARLSGASPEDKARQAERCLRDDVPGWRLWAWVPEGGAH
jgi:hypothetical protein